MYVAEAARHPVPQKARPGASVPTNQAQPPTAPRGPLPTAQIHRAMRRTVGRATARSRRPPSNRRLSRSRTIHQERPTKCRQPPARHPKRRELEQKFWVAWPRPLQLGFRTSSIFPVFLFKGPQQRNRSKRPTCRLSRLVRFCYPPRMNCDRATTSSLIMTVPGHVALQRLAGGETWLFAVFAMIVCIVWCAEQSGAANMGNPQNGRAG